MGKPDIVGYFRGRTEELKTADGITLYAHKSILGSENGSCPDDPWGSFKASTVERFLEHCYQGDCSDPKPVELPLVTPAGSVDGDEHFDGVFHVGTCLPLCQSVNSPVVPQDGSHVCCSCATAKPGTRASKINEHDNGKEEGGTKGNTTERPEPSDPPTEDNNDKDDSGSLEHPNGLDYGAVFLAHAELYILSQARGRSSLAAICLNRLREALDKAAKAPVRPRFAINLRDLLLYVYKHSNVGSIDGHQAYDLQKLVSSCVAKHIGEMKEECSSLMRCGGKMAEDLMSEVASRAISLESASKKEREREMQRERERAKKREREWAREWAREMAKASKSKSKSESESDSWTENESES